MNNDEQILIHFGTLGQKWHNRRYQYEDGTWTEEGKARRRIGSSDNVSEDYRRHHTKKKISEMSDKELNERVTRLQKENTYKNLTKSPVRKAFETLMKNEGKKLAVAIIKKSVGANSDDEVYEKFYDAAKDWVKKYKKEKAEFAEKNK